MEKRRFRVEGMTCAACAANVERAVKKVEGIEGVSVSLLAGSMELSGTAADDRVICAVAAAGYQAAPFGAAVAAEQKEDELVGMKRRLVTSLLMLIPLMYVSMGHMMGLPLPWFLHGTGNEMAFAFTQFLLCAPIALVNWTYFSRGFKALFHLTPNMDSLIALGSGAAYVYGVAVIYMLGYALGHGDMARAHELTMSLYFESGATILTLITLGKYFETRSKRRTGDAVKKLTELAPKTVVIEKNGGEAEVMLSDVRAGDVVRVKPGGGIPVDGTVLSGRSSVDESAMTGESLPFEVEEGSSVRAGTVNGTGYLRIEATRVGEETTLSQIVKLVEQASSSKPPIQRLADKIAGVFVPVVIAVAFLSAIFWLVLGEGVGFALSTLITVLVISCPCALGLATPVAVMVGTGRAATLGVLFKNAEALEKAHAVNTVVLDKTGTLTEGKPRVTDVVALDESLLPIALSLEEPSGHPLSAAVVAYAGEKGVKALVIDRFEAVPGRGVRALVAGETALGGNAAQMQETGMDISPLAREAEKRSDEGKTCMYFARGGHLLGMIAVADVPKADSAEAVRAFHALGVETVMLTGDNERTARAVAKALSIDQVIAGVLPGDKERHVRDLQEKGRVVAMVGDGVNDAPALTRADVGLAIGAGTDIAIESADVVLMKSSLMDAVAALELSRAVMRNIRENLFWAFFYNVLLIPLAAGVFYRWLGFTVNPMLGAAAMSVSSVCVVSNALRLFRFMPRAMRCVEKQKKIIPPIDKKEEKTLTKILSVEGMMCGHCKAHVEKALNAIPGVSATVDLEKKEAVATVTGDVSDDALKQAVADAGYTVAGIR